MKIGILTQPLHANYGGLLQNYALQQVLMRKGHDVETIDWAAPNSPHDKLYRIKMHILSKLKPSEYKYRYYPSPKENAIIRQHTNRFIQSYIKHTDVLTSLSEFSVQAKKAGYNAYVVGSDQCWRPMYNIFLPAMFLSFVDDKNVKRIAYAASFGTETREYSSIDADRYKNLVKQFDLISVREDSGVKLCREYFGVDAIHVLDPTMLLDMDDYVALINKEKEPESAGTLFNYILDPSESKSKFVNRVAVEKGLFPFQVLPKYQAETRTREDVKKRINDCVFPSVTAWLRAFMDAEMTIVDSFHGMVFSIIFNKPFWVLGNKHRGMARFTSLLKQFDLEDRLLDSDSWSICDVDKPIDWEKVNARREELKRISLGFLYDALG